MEKLEQKNNKYYTPEIEEFHVGFEFEVFDDDDNTWDLVCIDSQSVLCNVTGLTLEKRVKYLDKEDIESLGFTAINNSWYEIEIQFFIYKLHLGDTITIDSKYKAQDSLGSRLFAGKIKNKSELIDQLKRCQIL